MVSWWDAVTILWSEDPVRWEWSRSGDVAFARESLRRDLFVLSASTPLFSSPGIIEPILRAGAMDL